MPPDLGNRILAASLTLAIMTLPVIIASTKEALASVPVSFREACWNVGATRWQTIRARGAAQFHQRHPHRGDPAGVAARPAKPRPSCSPARCFIRRSRKASCFAYGLIDQCMALSMHLFTLATQVPDVKESVPCATAVVLLGAVLLVNASAIVLRVWMRNRKKW